MRQRLLPQQKEPGGWLEGVVVCSLDLTSKSLISLARWNAMGGVALNTLAQREEEDRI